MTDNLWFWLGFGAFILTMLALDLGVFHRKAHTVHAREALGWTAVWVTLASLFGWWIWSTRGSTAGIEFFTGYLIELSLSADNVFVFSIIFTYFAVPAAYQHKVLFWGVLSALVLRFVMIWCGAALVERFLWLLYLFGLFLIVTGLKMLLSRETKHDPESNPIVKLFRRFVPMSDDFDRDHFLTMKNGRRLATPLLLVLVCVEVSDVIFAVDSIPAIFSITRDPFIVFTSNVFAIMGLRSLYFLLAEAVEKFHLLRPGLGVILSFVGVKMLLAHTEYKIPTPIALGVVVAVLIGAVVGSLIWPKAAAKSAEA
jgi:tellurite resistance protein TerC